ncbi:LANO_0B04984g1_1 [Lachancea nothofagi CBS 11611]|uniref:LANO_0B04984g1_1 n=1 Tax=Lachancea nothofagi CBS 11611 TaxID=1266666 RepID=A0A1G4IYP7_9SACH|nr:LANO_0B04984g1_1 [Lachancea nothofagi CBS 11611]
MANILTKSLAQVHPKLRTNGIGIGNNHRKISLGFLQPSKRNPLVRKYKRRRRYGTDQQSFRSLGEDFGSTIAREDPMIDAIDEELDAAGSEDGGELSRTVSLPSRVSETPDVHSEVDWILEEHERRYSSAQHSDEEFQNEEEDTQPRRSSLNYDEEQQEVLEYDDFMKRVRQQLLFDVNRRQHRPSFISVTSRGSVPNVYESLESEEECKHGTVTLKSEAKVLASYSIPLILTFLLEQIFPLVCSLTVGHLGKNELAAVSLASMTTNITLAVFEGISTSLDTLCPQAFGSGNYRGVGIHLQRCIAFSMVVYVPFAFFWFFSEFFLGLVIKEKELVSLTAKFLRIAILGAPAYIMFENLKRFLQAQGIFDAGIYVLLVCAPLNVLTSYTLVWNSKIGIGYAGAPIAMVLNFWLMLALLLAYIVYVDGSRCWGGFNKKAFTHWKALSELAIPGIVMLEAEDLSYEILTLFSSYFGTSYLAAQSAISTTVTLTYMIPFAVGISSSTRIANFVGAKRADCAKIASQLGISCSLFVGLFNCILLISCRNFIAHIYSNDPEVVKLITELMPLAGVAEIFDSLNAIAGSCLRGQGMQAIGGVINLVVYYLLAIPLAIVLGWTFDMKLFGLWIGIGTGMFLIGTIEGYLVLFPNWEKILRRAEMRREAEEADELDSEDDYSSTDSDEEPDEETRLLRN